MILIQDAKGGLTIRRDTDPVDRPPLFVRTDELAAFLADLLTHATTTAATSTDAWDTWAWLCGNDEAALA
jgi:hypothetical protein